MIGSNRQESTQIDLKIDSDRLICEVIVWKGFSGLLFISGVWAHGDFIHKNPKTQGGVVMLGRSDGTLNPNGVRFGSAEIYNIVEPFIEIIDR